MVVMTDFIDLRNNRHRILMFTLLTFIALC